MYQILMEKLDWVRQHQNMWQECAVGTSQYERIQKSAEEYGFLAVDIQTAVREFLLR